MNHSHPHRFAFLVHTHPGQRSAVELMREAAAGMRPRRDYLELAAILGADVIDAAWMEGAAQPSSRMVLRVAGMPGAQVWEALLRRRQYATVCAWSDRIGLPLALVSKIVRSRSDLTMVSAWPSRPKKAFFLRHLRVHSHVRAIISGSDAQLRHARDRLRVPSHKLHHLPWPVDERFWTPDHREPEDLICAVGWEARDYETLMAASRDLPIEIRVAVGVAHIAGPSPEPEPRRSAAPPSRHRPDPFESLRGTYSYRRTLGFVHAENLPVRGRLRVEQQLHPRDLRALYGRARFVVVPLHDVDSDCGVTTITEAMAMSKAVIVTCTRGNTGLITDGEHGLLVPPGDVRALRSAIEHLLQDPRAAERMGRAGRRLIERRHSLDAHVQRFARILLDAPEPVRTAGAASRRRPV